MWKILLVALAVTLLAFAQARPSYLHTSVIPTYEHIEYAPTVVAHELHSIPTAVSHQSQTIVHEKRPYLRPIVEHTPIIKSYSTPTVALGWPASYSPLAYSGLYDHGWRASYGTPLYTGWGGWPLK